MATKDAAVLAREIATSIRAREVELEALKRAYRALSGKEGPARRGRPPKQKAG